MYVKKRSQHLIWQPQPFRKEQRKHASRCRRSWSGRRTKERSPRKASLTNLASLYVVSGKDKYLSRPAATHRAFRLTGYPAWLLIPVDVNLPKIVDKYATTWLAETKTTDICDLADLQYTAYRIEAQARNFMKATDNIQLLSHLIDLLDTLEHAVFRRHGGNANILKNGLIFCRIPDEKLYFLGNRSSNCNPSDDRVVITSPANACDCNANVPTAICYWQKKPIPEHKTLTERMEGQRNTENHLKGLIASRFDTLTNWKTYYGTRESPHHNRPPCSTKWNNNHRFCENNEMLQELELS